MKFTITGLTLATLALATPTPFKPVAQLPFPQNATIISVPSPSQDRTGTPTRLQGDNPSDPTNNTLSAPFTPAGGDIQDTPICSLFSIFLSIDSILTSRTTDKAVTNFDFQSLNLALNQELFELDLFTFGLSKFSVEEFEAAGIDAAGRDLIAFMADQEVGHANLLRDILGPDRAALQCTYQYPFTTVGQFIEYSQLVTRVGESGVLGKSNLE